MSEQLSSQLGSSTNGPKSLELARWWIRNCCKKHADCSKKDSDWFPSRIIDVGNGIEDPKLIQSGEAQLGHEYATLSHCWGSRPIHTLTTKTSPQFLDKLDKSLLPPTFRDAITITRRLGYRYLWIDSLCIIQDSVEDWRKESSVMGKTYKNSVVTIAATGSIDSHGGCFHDRDPRLIQPCRIQAHLCSPTTPTKEILHIYESKWPWLHFSRLNTKGLNTRAWVFQERMLSRRILHFGSEQLHWECLEDQASEKFPEGLDFWDAQPNREERLKTLLKAPSLASRPWLDEEFTKMLDEKSTRYADWNQLVGYYSQLNLTKSADILIALSALAKEWAGFLDDEYLAGLWKNDLLRELLWYIVSVMEKDQGKRYTEYHAPSWSWASVDSRSEVTNLVVDYFQKPSICIPVAEIINTCVTPIGFDITGQIKDAFIRISGPLKIASLAETKKGKWQIGDATLFDNAHKNNNCYPDIPLRSRASVVCLQIIFIKKHWGYRSAFALMLEPVNEKDSTYTRLGCAVFRGKIASEWFQNSQTQTVKLV
jgi:hypothetical protein